EPEPEPEPEPISPTHAAGDKGAPMREGPEGTAKAAGRLDPDEQVEVIGSEGNWSKVRTAAGIEAWVSNRSLTALASDAAAPAEPAAAAPAASGWQPTHTVPEGGLPARDKPDPGRDPLLRIKTGTAVKVTGSEGAWSRVTIESGWEAWVDGRRLEPIGGAAAAPAPAPAPEPAPAPAPEPEPWRATHTIPEGGLSAWTEPKAETQPILKIRTGTEVQVVKTLGAWSRVQTAEGWEAWVDGRRLVAKG
ncbi:MAG: SH3 domain-containing protein, partial [Actinobacteria bacterium]|nr:SH3 domain-containing protein [Actinomycetota bacterium]